MASNLNSTIFHFLHLSKIFNGIRSWVNRMSDVCANQRSVRRLLFVFFLMLLNTLAGFELRTV